MKHLPAYKKSLINTLILASLPLAGAAFAEDECYSKEKAAYVLADAAAAGAKAVYYAEQEMMTVCKKSFDNKDLSLANLLEVQKIFASANPPKIVIKDTGSVYYEGIDSCGYHPQRREGSCSIEVKKPFGFGGQPSVGPGSWEYMAFCVYGLPSNPLGWTLQNISAVHVHDEAFGATPSWYYTITDQAETNLHTTPVNGKTYLAKSILSWGIKPKGCNHDPIWGNEAYYRIRLDP